MRIKPCPYCDGEITAHDCGYSTFNPGWVACAECDTEWDCGMVNDSKGSTYTWNTYQPFARQIELAEKELSDLRKKAGGCRIKNREKYNEKNKRKKRQNN